MAALDTHFPLPQATLTGNRLADYVFGAVRLFMSWRERRATLIELSRMNDVTLEDVGLTRGEINDLLNGRR